MHLQLFVDVGVKSGLISRRSAATTVSGVRIAWRCKQSLLELPDGGSELLFMLLMLLCGTGYRMEVTQCIASDCEGDNPIDGIDYDDLEYCLLTY